MHFFGSAVCPEVAAQPDGEGFAAIGEFLEVRALAVVGIRLSAVLPADADAAEAVDDFAVRADAGATAVQGIPVCFDAKECKTDSFPLANIHEHQVTFMKDFEQQGGISFLLLYFTARDEYYYLRYETMKTFWDRGQNGGKKHFSYTELETSFFLPRTGSSVLVPYLNGIQKDLEIRDSKAN